MIDINWNLLTQERPVDLVEIDTLGNITNELSRDKLRYVIASSFLELKEPHEATKWIAQIENAETRRELEEMRDAH